MGERLTEGEFPRVPAWCTEHDDIAWVYDDGSGSCWYTCVVEMGSDECVLVKLPKSVANAIERTRLAADPEGGPTDG